jgi:membrane associated rhomboid family serine protease
MNDIREYITLAPVASLFFAITLVSSFIAFQNPQQKIRWMLNPYTLIRQRRYGTLFTSGLIHGDFSHLLFNMITFFYFAFPLEMFMVLSKGISGHIIFAAFYILTMVLSDISTIIKQKDNPSYFSLGASGAISAIIFGFIYFDPTAKMGILFIPIPISAPVFGLLYILYSIYSSRHNRDNINHEAHLWGGLTGFIFCLIVFYEQLPIFLDEIGGMLRHIL